MITFAAGTIYLLIKDFKLAENRALLTSKPYWVWVTVGSAAAALIFALGWRSESQILMEHQIYGLKDSATRYFKMLGAEPPVALDTNIKGHELRNRILKFSTIACLAFAWGGMIFILK